MIGCGILAVILSYRLPGAGPCGPSTTIGFVIMMLDLIAIPGGALTVLVGAITNRVSRASGTSHES